MRILIFILIMFSTGMLKADQQPIVILVSLDGFRWDYLQPETSPSLHAISQQGVKAVSLQPPFPSKTFPSHYTMITGMFPQNHGLVNNRFVNPENGALYAVGTKSVHEPHWYFGTPFWLVLQKKNINTASLFWPLTWSNAVDERPTYSFPYDVSLPKQDRINQLLYWLTLPASQAPAFIMMYASDTDTVGHIHGPQSPECFSAVKNLDTWIGQIVTMLQKNNLYHIVNIVIVSDHGMSKIHPVRVDDFSEIVGQPGITISGYSPVASLFIKNKQQRDRVFSQLQATSTYTHVYYKAQVPQHLHYNSGPLIGDIVLIAKENSRFHLSYETKEINHKGDHGYDPYNKDMHGIFIAHGPLFKKRFLTSTLFAEDIVPLLRRIYGLSQQKELDGKLKRIQHILH